MDEEFPTRLRRLRERRGMNRKILAECCGLSKNCVARYERGEKEPKLSSLVAMADFFEVSLDDLIGRKPP
jgi:transcriptional regulator with XRE-family HTH domain